MGQIGVESIDIIAVDISGRHKVQGRYEMVCAAVSLHVSPVFIEKIYTVRLLPRLADSLDINMIADFISEACLCLPGTIVAEPGDLYNLEIWRVKSILGRDFKYPETIAERGAVEMAHHISVAGRRLIVNE
ncbi:MAG TPA: DUF2209 family protein [Methanothrix sp.]|nr:DUF2209 family protein [Methanothrix sp.]HPT18832.1 DUF2209 family protein [Methanothrix sp.]